MNPELQEQLAKYMKKWGTCGLMLATQLDRDGASEAEYQHAREVVRRRLAKEAERVLHALDALRPALDVALMCASPECRDKYGFRAVTVDEVLGGDPGTDDQQETQDGCS